jgi:hypothetical protein
MVLLFALRAAPSKSHLRLSRRANRRDSSGYLEFPADEELVPIFYRSPIQSEFDEALTYAMGVAALRWNGPAILSGGVRERSFMTRFLTLVP